MTARIVFALMLSSGLAACGSTSQSPASNGEEAANQGLPDRDPSLARRLVREDGALLLDVRSQSEFDGGHVEGATLIPHTEIAGRIDEILKAQGGDKSKPIVVYCRSGRRATTAKQTLIDNGFDQVSNLGGASDWCEDC